MNIQEATQLIKNQNDLAIEDMANLMTGIFSGEYTEDQIILFLEELALKGESISELIGAVKVMRNFSVKVKAPYPGLIDCCGTGGLGKSMMNVSTTSARQHRTPRNCTASSHDCKKTKALPQGCA